MAMRAMKRREFLIEACRFGKIGAFGLAAARWPGAARAADSAYGTAPRIGGHGIMLKEVTVSVFEECVGNTFRIHADAGISVDAELIEATALGSRSGSSGVVAPRDAFSIVFRGPVEPVLPQKIYTLEHAKLGRFELFLVPIGPDAGGMCYEAVFN